MVCLALGYVGTTAPAIEYLDLIAPGETDARRAEMAKMSGCALVVRGLWRLAGVGHPRLDRPYVTGKAVEDVVSIAREADALRAVLVPEPGDVVHVVGSEHVYVAVAVEPGPNGSSAVESVDGGQRTAGGLQTIRKYRRKIVAGRDMRLDDRGRIVVSRQIATVIDCAKVLSTFASRI